MENFIIAHFDDGHDFHEVKFYADPNLPEEELKAEAKAIARRRYGKITRGWRYMGYSDYGPDAVM